MKKMLFLFLFVSFCFNAFAQKQYTINGKTYTLKTEVNGSIDLLWNLFNHEYRYFVKKDNIITELVNTKDDTKKFQEEYKETLSNLTKESGLKIDKVKLTLYSLRIFLNKYNASQDPNYVATNTAIAQSILLIFGGVTNSPFKGNISNISNILIGGEIEVFEAANFPRHSIYLQFQHRFQSDSFQYSQTQFGIGYRFRVFNKKKVSIYTNILAAAYSFNKQTITFFDDGVLTEKEISENGFTVPFIFGVGVDFKVTNHSFFTLNYNELFALFSESSNNFSTNITLGYKFNL